MSTVLFNNKSYSLEPKDSVLSCLLREGIAYPNSCQAGICQSCLIKATQGEIHPSWQEGLPETLKAQGYFLACLAKPEHDLTLLSPKACECEISARIIEIHALNDTVLQVKIQADTLDDWQPGQYLTLINEEQTTRSYSIANRPAQDQYIELHVKCVPNGKMSQWLRHAAHIGKTVQLRGPFGKCYYYNPHHASYDMILIGTGTGLAPLVGVIKEALHQAHCGRITLIHGGLVDKDIYYSQQIQALVAAYDSFEYLPCVLQTQGLFPQCSVEQLMLEQIKNHNTPHVFVCGPKETTNKLKTAAFLAGVPSSLILSDAFL